MRVLVTGSTATQVGRPNSTGFVSAPVLLVQALRDHGHQVDWRPVTPGEKLSGYHRVISFLTPPLTFGSLHYYGALWALTHPKAVVALDDWRFMTIVSQAASCDRERWRLWESPPAMNRKGEEREAAIKHRKVIEDLNNKLIFGRGGDDGKKGLSCQWPWPVAAPLFSWWNRDKFPLVTPKVYAYDPTPLMPKPVVKRLSSSGDTDKTWLLASLSNHQDWLDKLRPKLQWGVDYYGGTAKLRKSGYALPAIQEADLVSRVYPSYRATLCPPYPHAGSGWWRARLVHAAWAGCVTVGFNGELDSASAAYAYEPGEIEAMTPRRLAEVARAQAATIHGRCTRPALNAAASDLINLT